MGGGVGFVLDGLGVSGRYYVWVRLIIVEVLGALTSIWIVIWRAESLENREFPRQRSAS